MGDLYTLGLAAGFAAGLGVVLAGILGGRRPALVVVTLVAAALGAAVGAVVIEDWSEGVAGALGGALGGAGAVQVVQGAARRGGTTGGLALIVGAAGVVLAGLAFVPFVGYVEALAVPLVGARLRSRAAERFAGLRTLAK